MRRLATALLAATAITCIGAPHRAAAQTSPSCERVTGELDAWNGSPSLRIQAGPHLIGIVSSPSHPLPPAITKDVDFAHSVTGLFTVCKLGQAQPNGMIYALAPTRPTPENHSRTLASKKSLFESFRTPVQSRITADPEG